MPSSLRPGAAPWWQSAVVYQIYPRSFQDTTGNGIGDLAGITARLDYLTEVLGVDAVWISPFYPSPQADFGYDVSDYTDVDPLLGDLAGFDHLVAEAHRRDLRVIVDLVVNHTSCEHVWFQDARASRTAGKRDWYIWRDPGPDGGPPNNWLSIFGGPAWTLDEHTGQYYLHTFLPEQPDLDWRNPAVREAMFDCVRFWLDRGVDGFRLDAAHFVGKDPALRDNPPNTEAAYQFHKPLGAYDSQLHVHDADHPDAHVFYRELRGVLDAYQPPRICIGEMHIYDWQRWARYYGEALDEMHLPFNFRLLTVPFEARAIGAVTDAQEAALPPGGWPNHVLGNHDEPRLATRLGPGRCRLAAMLLLTLRGTPTLYYGDELGMEDVAIPPDRRQDFWGEAEGIGLCRDGCRTPMPWSAAPGAGFSTAPEPWLPLGPDWRARNVEAQLGDPRSLLELYRGLLRLRRETPALSLGDYRPLAQVPGDCLVFERTYGAERCTVALNFGERPAVTPVAGAGRIVLSTDVDRDRAPVAGEVSLGPAEGLIVVHDS